MLKNTAIYDYDSDPRTECKYGSECYRKNKDHLETYKHPISSTKNVTGSPERPAKKHKPDSCNTRESNSPKNKLKEANTPSPTKKQKEANTPSPTKKQKEANNPSPTKKQKEVNLPLKNHPDDHTKNNGISTQNEPTRGKETGTKKIELNNDPKELIKQLFLVEMPEDFYSFWAMCEMLNKQDPINSLKDVKLKLVGPFDVLAGRVSEVFEEELPNYLRHWRYYYDPPEFQTVIASGDSRCFHMGYYRDDPKEKPVFIATNALNSKNPEKNGELKIVGPNLFSALNAYLEDLKTDPFARMKVPKFQKTLTNWAKEKGFSLEKTSTEMDARKRKVVAKTFHGAGIVVPVDKKNDVGYRELAASNAMIKKILKGIVESKSDEERTKYWEQLQPVITFANIANDECDFGTSLELGLDLFTYGSPLLHRTTKLLLTTAYNLLGRPEFARIVEAHLEDRKNGGDLSVIH